VTYNIFQKLVFIFGMYVAKEVLDCKKIIKKIYTLENKK